MLQSIVKDKVKVAIVDDHGFIREGIKHHLLKHDQYHIVAEAASGEGILRILPKISCDVLILDLSMPVMDGLAVLERVRLLFPQLPVLILTLYKDYRHFKKAMSLGARGFMLKEDACELLHSALHTILSGKPYVSESVSLMITDRIVRDYYESDAPCLEILTSRERDILRLISQGLANKNIAQNLNISIRTVENHRLHLSDKLGIKSTAGLVKYAIAKGLA